MDFLFRSTKYRDFLRKMFPSKGENRGRRRELAKRLGCQTSLISLVLTDRAHLNEDMIFKCSQFLGMNSVETDFLLNIYHLERAGTPVLRGYYQKKISQMIESRTQVKERVGASITLPLEIQAQYYSNWTYAAVHTVVMNPKTRSLALIADKLNLNESLALQTLEFLEQWKFVVNTGDYYEPGSTRLHLSSDSPFIVQHHRNWSMEAMRAAGDKNPLDLNYSGALSMSKNDAENIRELLLNAISSIEKQIAPSPDEDVVGISLSWFRY